MTEVKSLLSEYPTSKILYFLSVSKEKHWSIGDATNECTTDVKVSVLQQLETVCPKLIEVSFPDDESLCRFHVQDDGILGPWTSDWFIVGSPLHTGVAHTLSTWYSWWWSLKTFCSVFRYIAVLFHNRMPPVMFISDVLRRQGELVRHIWSLTFREMSYHERAE